MSSKRRLACTWLAIGALHLLAMLWALDTQCWRFPDTDRYQQAAANLREHGVLYARPWSGATPRGKDVQEYTIRPPGYPLFMSALAGTGSRPLLLLLAQNLLSVANLLWVLAWWQRRYQPSWRGWAVAAGLAVSLPGQLIYANAVMSEMLLQTVVLAGVAAAGLFSRTHRRRYFAAASLAVGLALLIKPVFYPLTIIGAAAGAVVAGRQRRVSLALLGLGPLLLAVLYMGWNQQRTGYFHFSSIADINLLHYNAAGVVRQVAGPAAESEWVAQVLRQADAQPTFAARQELIRAQATGMMWAHPLVYMRQQVQGMAAFFLDPGRFELAQFLQLPALPGGGLLAQSRSGHLISALAQLPLGLISVLAALILLNAARLVVAVRGFCRLATAEPGLRYGRWVAAGVIGYVALLTGPLGAARFLVPVWPLLLGLVLAGISPRPGPRPAAGQGAAREA